MTTYGRQLQMCDRQRSFEIQPEYLTILESVHGDYRRMRLARAVARWGCYGEMPELDDDGELAEAFETICNTLVVGPWRTTRMARK